MCKFFIVMLSLHNSQEETLFISLKMRCNKFFVSYSSLIWTRFLKNLHPNYILFKVYLSPRGSAVKEHQDVSSSRHHMKAISVFKQHHLICQLIFPFYLRTLKLSIIVIIITHDNHPSPWKMRTKELKSWCVNSQAFFFTLLSCMRYCMLFTIHIAWFFTSELWNI